MFFPSRRVPSSCGYYYVLCIQDDFSVTSKLTLNLDLRWEPEPGVYEQQDGMIVNFDRTATNPLAASVTPPCQYS